MERHLSTAALARLFTGQTAHSEAEIAEAHVGRCRHCLDLAATVAAELRRSGSLLGLQERGRAVLGLLEAEEKTARRRLLAHSGWAELKKLAMEDQLERLGSKPELQTLEMFQAVVADAAAQDDLLLGEERAFVAHVLAGRLAEGCCSQAVRHDLQGQALLAAAGCRRRAGNGRGADSVLKAAHAHFEQGTGDPVWQARFLAAQAMQAAETGDLDRARACLSRASEILRETENPAAAASIEIQTAAILCAAGRHQEALERAERAASWLTPREPRLEAQARGLLAECLLGLGQPVEAFRSFLAASQLDEQPGPDGGRPGHLGPLLLDALERGGGDAAGARPAAEEPQPPQATASGLFDEAIGRYDRQLIAAGLAQCGGSILETARLLDIARNTLRTKMRLYGLDGAARRSFDALVPALAESERQALDRLRVRGCWKELQRLPAAQQIEQLAHLPSFQTREMFETVIDAASAEAQEDPARGEETAIVAQALACLLPRSCCPEALKRDFLSETLRVIGNCRRLSGDWPSSADALAEARSLLAQGTGDPRREARLLSVEASLASDTGRLEHALGLLTRAATIHRRAQDAVAVRAITIQEANSFLSGGHHEEAMARAEDALRGMTPREARLEMLARSIVTECLAFLGRPEEALRSLSVTWPLYEQLRASRTDLRLGNLEAFVLEALGYAREAEAAFRHCIAGYIEAGLYKDAFLTMLTRFESLFRRGAWSQAARACEEALALERQIGAPGHGQMIELWRGLLILVNGQRLTRQRVLAARQALVRHWSAPADPTASSGVAALRWDGNGSAALIASIPLQATPAGAKARLFTVAPPAVPERLAGGDYQEAIESYERRLIEAGLARCHGHIRPTARLLGVSRTALKAKIEKFGLSAVA